MIEIINVSRPIQVKTGDCRREWMDAKIISIFYDGRHISVDDEWDEFSIGIEFPNGLTQRVTDIHGLSKNEWRYKI